MVKILKSGLKLEYRPLEDVPVALVKMLKALDEAEKVSRYPATDRYENGTCPSLSCFAGHGS